MPIDSIPELLAAYERNFVPERAAGVNGTVQLDLSGDGGGQWVLEFKDQTFSTREGSTEDPTVRVMADARDWIDMSVGNANPMAMMMTGKLKMKGSIALATKFNSLFKGR
ncbi:MAG: SCP2 sterol-binding domain-containing protein [Rhodothermales bacterium]|nr:SCP2 sterol-binding domain-containing protein [Rhodothermales bacterium]MBO6780787.1 SCP2 sterol-binding domain-containing protein [Rhodothermales bacterium]